MGPIQFVIILIIVGFALWVVNNSIPMDMKIKQILNIVIIVATVLWIGSLFGLFGFLRGIHIGK